jgi:hypothetical protein
MFEIDECPFAPDLLEQLLARQFARLPQQRNQNLKGCFGKRIREPRLKSSPEEAFTSNGPKASRTEDFGGVNMPTAEA